MTDSLNILLTGLPRSGTTLVCHLLNKLPNSVALHEPMRVSELATKSTDELCEEIAGFFKTQRANILEKGVATSKVFSGRVPSNPISDETQDGVRLRLIDGRELRVNNVTHDHFSLVIKHPAFFTAALPVLARRFVCFAVVRNPLSVILSWRDSGLSVAQGNMPAAESWDYELKEELKSHRNPLEKQLALLDYCFRRYSVYLKERVIRYEDIVSSAGEALRVLNSHSVLLKESLESRNGRVIFNDPDVFKVAEALLERDSPCWDFYRREDILALLRSPGRPLIR